MRLPQPSSGAERFFFLPVRGDGAAWLFWALLIGLTLIRLALAASLGLTPDEAYYWTWSQHLQPGYLDHPPMIALWIRIGTALCGQNALGIRLLGPLSALIGSVVLALAGRDLLGSKGAGYRAAVLLNATLMLGLGAATATPDTPLVFFLALALWALGRLIVSGHAVWWLAIGLFFGLAFDSKYTALLPALGCGLWALSTAHVRRQVVALIGGVVFGVAAITPVLFWNATHHWASFAKQGGRAGDWHPLRAFSFLAELIGGQIGLATPLVFVLFGVGVAWCVRRVRSNDVARLLTLLCVVPVLVFVQHAFGGRVQANWPVVLYPAAALAAAATGRRIGVACTLGLALTAIVTLQGLCAPLRLSAHHDVIARQTADWSGLASRVREEMPAGRALVVGDYALAAIMTYYDQTRPVFSYDNRWAYLDRARVPPGRAMLLLRESEKPDLPASWQDQRQDQGGGEARRVCRLLRSEPILCYRLIPLDVPPETTMFRLP